MGYVKRCFAGILGLCSILLMDASSAFPQPSSATILATKQYDKPKGKPVAYTDTFQATSTSGTYTLWVQSGTDGLAEVKNVSVSLNGVEIIDSSDLRNNNPASKVISVQSTNNIAVALKGQGGNHITVKVLCEGCSPSATGTISPQGGTVTLEGYATTTFPAGAFAASQDVTISATSLPETQEDYSVTADIDEKGSRLPHEIRINSGLIAPSTSVELLILLPDAFIAALPLNAELQAFIQILYDGANETLDQFYLFPSSFDPATKTLHVILPVSAFTDQRHLENTYEAIVIVDAAF